MKPGQKIIRLLLPFLILAGILGFLFQETLLPPPGKYIYGSDINDQFYFWKSYYADSIKNGTVPFWNPYNFSGTPFLAHPSVAAFYPFNLIFLIMPLSYAFAVFLYLHLLIGGWGMYLLLKRNTDTVSSLTGSVIFSLSGMMALRIYAGHVDIISTVVWIPWFFSYIMKYLTEKSKSVFVKSILFLALMILAGYQAVVIFTIELISIFILVNTILMHNRQGMIKIIFEKFIKLILICVTAYGLASVQVLPTLEFVSRSIRALGLSYEAASKGSYQWDTFRLFLDPFAYGNPLWHKYSYHGPGPNYHELAYFSGAIPVIIISVYLLWHIIGIIKKRKIDPIVTGLIIPLIFFLLLSLGKNFPLHSFFYQIFPPYRLFRFPSQHLIIAVFLIALISGLIISRIKNVWFRLIILIMITIELVRFDRLFIQLSDLPTLQFDSRLTDLAKRGEISGWLLPYFYVVSPVRSAMDFESTSYFQILSTSGYNPLILNNYYRFIDLLNKVSGSSVPYFNVEIPLPDLKSPLIDYLNVDLLLADTRDTFITGKIPDRFELIEKTSKYSLYKNKKSAPPFFSVSHAISYQSRDDAETDILNGKSDLRKTVILELENKDVLRRWNINCSEKSRSDVKIVNYTPNRVILSVNADCNGILSSSEIYYPGWKAEIDGKKTDILLANTAFRAIYLPSGNHKVIFYYQPDIYYLGGLISIFTLICLAFYYYKRNNKNRT